MTQDDALEGELAEDEEAEAPRELDLRRPSDLARDHADAMLARQEIVSRVMEAAVSRTAPTHWVDYGGEADPRPEDEAAYTLLTVMGAQTHWLPVAPGGGIWLERPLEDGKHFEIIVHLEASAFGRTVQVVGSARSDDSFLTGSGKRSRDGVAFWTDVLKKAQANANVRAVLALGGAAITWETLERAGIPRERVHRVAFAQSETVAAKEAARAATGAPCPRCGRPLVLRRSKRGMFLGCSGYPSCRYTQEAAGTASTAEEAAGTASTAEEAAGRAAAKAGQKPATKPAPEPEPEPEPEEEPKAPAPEENAPAPEEDPWQEEKPGMSEEELFAALRQEAQRVFADPRAEALAWVRKHHGSQVVGFRWFVRNMRGSAERTLADWQAMPDAH